MPKSVDPCLGQGRGGAWDHRRCGTCFVTAMDLTFQQQLLLCVSAVCQASKEANAPRQLPRPNLPAGLSKATLAATRPSQRFKPFRRPCQGNSRSYTPQPAVFKGVEALFARRQTLQTLTLKPFRRPFQGNSRSYTLQPSVF